MTPEPFTIDVPQAVLDDLHYRLRNTRWADDFANDDWGYGVEAGYLKEVVDYWLNEYDWRAREREMNSFSHFRTQVDGVPVHFIREPGKGPNPIPLIVSHGWPWSFWDFKDIIRPLADPAAFGGDPEDAFEVIATSMPGFGFSTPLRKPGLNAYGVADLWHKLMTEQLGFDRYAAQGGDWGAMTTAQLGHKYADHLYGIHMSLTPKMDHWNNERPWDVTRGQMVPESLPPEQREEIIDIQHRIAAHVAVHMLGPQTLAYALNDSPVGLLAWIMERRRAWSGCDGDLENSFSKDFMLDLIMIYWLTESIGTSMRIYAEAGKVPWAPSHDRTPMIEAPTGLSFFAQDVVRRNPDIEAHYNVHYVKEHPVGGHFAAAERPDAIVEDVRATFRELR
ncbi:MAG: epoxide hydrolase [Alphaproteobacteria bacterium]|nr:epoxide hydrolase [Alphaproteobacteria bacterium]